MYPRIVIDKNKLFHNTKIIVDKAARYGIGVFAVAKVYCGIPELAQVSVDAGVVGIADSRVANLRKLSVVPVDKMLLRLTMLSEVDEVVDCANISLNSELETIKALNEAAIRKHKRHQIILMVDLGDLREGILPEDVHGIVPEILKLEAVDLVGVGVNLTCYGGVIPNEDNLGQLTSIANDIENTYGVKLKFISGGNSSSLYLLDNGEIPSKINQLRVGEGIVLGREAAYGEPILGSFDDAFMLEAEIIELKEKDSMPKGVIGMDAFGNKPVFEDRGKMLRAIVAIGRQDVDHTALIPENKGVEILGASSDHMILNVTQSPNSYKVGDVVRFKMEYGAMLKLFTSEYVDKIML